MHYIKIIIRSIVFSLLIFVCTYLSMQTFADQPAASCLSCSYLKDTFFLSLFSLLVIPPVLLFLTKAKITHTPFSLIVSLIFLFIAFIINWNLFYDRVSSWSSYSTKDEVIATIAQSYPFILTGSVLVFIIFYTGYQTDKTI